MKAPLVTAAAVIGASMLLTATPAYADTNTNVHSPSLLCGPGTLTATQSSSLCAARQDAQQKVDKQGTADSGLVNMANVIIPAAAGS